MFLRRIFFTHAFYAIFVLFLLAPLWYANNAPPLLVATKDKSARSLVHRQLDYLINNSADVGNLEFLNQNTTELHIKNPNIRTLVPYSRHRIGVPMKSLQLNRRDNYVNCDDIYYLGDANIYEDCSRICRESTDYVYEYMYSNSDDPLEFNGELLFGAYCVLKSVNACNRRISDVVQLSNGFYCLSKFPRMFGGSTGNKIIGCGGELRDNLFDTVYTNYFPIDVEITDIDEYMPGEDFKKYRFECATNVDSQSNDKLIPPDFDRFKGIPNYCASLIYRADPSIVADWNTGECICNQERDDIKHLFDKKINPCTTCYTRWQKNAVGLTIKKPCISIGTPSEFWNDLLFPCSKAALQLGTSCEQATLQATTTYSPMALQAIL
ncbi:Pif-2 protein [Dolichomitus sp. PSUC_FEM 10030005]|nr:Pif-2 protein [Dolichomitus sp. PSUC_FEM 10030005]